MRVYAAMFTTAGYNAVGMKVAVVVLNRSNRPGFEQCTCRVIVRPLLCIKLVAVRPCLQVQAPCSFSAGAEKRAIAGVWNHIEALLAGGCEAFVRWAPSLVAAAVLHAVSRFIYRPAFFNSTAYWYTSVSAWIPQFSHVPCGVNLGH